MTRLCARVGLVGVLLLTSQRAFAIPITTDFPAFARSIGFEEIAVGTGVAAQDVGLGVSWYGRHTELGDDGDPARSHSGSVGLSNANLYVDSCPPEPQGCSGHLDVYRLVATGAMRGSPGSGNGIIGAEFVDANGGVLATTDAAGGWIFTHQAHPNAYVQMSVYDLAGELLETLRLASTGDNLFVGIQTAGIHRRRRCGSWRWAPLG